MEVIFLSSVYNCLYEFNSWPPGFISHCSDWPVAMLDKISMPEQGDTAYVHCSLYAVTHAQHDKLR